MVGIRDYYSNDFPNSVKMSIGSSDDDSGSEVRIHYDFDANASYLSCLVPGNAQPVDIFLKLIGHRGAAEMDLFGRGYEAVQFCDVKHRWSRVQNSHARRPCNSAQFGPRAD
jgi:hypothetical protein